MALCSYIGDLSLHRYDIEYMVLSSVLVSGKMFILV